METFCKNMKEYTNKHSRFSAVLLLFMAGLLSACSGGTGQSGVSSSESASVSGEASESAASGEELPSSGETEDAETVSGTDDAETAEEGDGFSESVTFMIYMVGSDLESSAAAATEDLSEIAASGVDTEKVNLLV